MKIIYTDLSIYNKEEIVSTLEVDMSISDEALLLKAHLTWGETLFNEINGDFAFALHDSRRDEIFAARDPLGIKALYYTQYEGVYHFSDNIDELFALGIEKKPNITSMQTLLDQKAVDYEETMYIGIKRVPPGHYIKIFQNKSTLSRYWFPEKIKTDYTISLKDAALKFNRLLEKAILSRIEEDSKTAYELSGGVDSSSIVSMVKTLYPEKKTDIYSMCFNGLQCDEYPYIRAVEEKFDFHSVKIESGEIDYEKKYDHRFNYQISPHWPVILTFTMYMPMVERMQKDGKKIIITGQGGDHLLLGNCYTVADLFQRGEYGKVLDQLSQSFDISVRYLECMVFSLFSHKVVRNLKDAIKKLLYFLSIKKRKDESIFIKDLFRLNGITSVSKRAEINPLVSARQSTTMDGNIFHAIENVSDVEYRHPFFDKELVEYVLSLPSEYKNSKGWNKVLLRFAMEDILPQKIRSRRDKAEFSEVLVKQLQVMDIEKILHHSHLLSLGLISQKKIEGLIESFNKKEYDEILHLWTIVNVEYWYESAICSQ